MELSKVSVSKDKETGSFMIGFSFEGAKEGEACYIGFLVEHGMTPELLAKRFERFMEIYRERFIT